MIKIDTEEPSIGFSLLMFRGFSSRSSPGEMRLEMENGKVEDEYGGREYL